MANKVYKDRDNEIIFLDVSQMSDTDFGLNSILAFVASINISDSYGKINTVDLTNREQILRIKQFLFEHPQALNSLQSLMEEIKTKAAKTQASLEG